MNNLTDRAWIVIGFIVATVLAVEILWFVFFADTMVGASSFPKTICHHTPANQVTLTFQNQQSYNGHLGQPHSGQTYDTNGACVTPTPSVSPSPSVTPALTVTPTVTQPEATPSPTAEPSATPTPEDHSSPPDLFDENSCTVRDCNTHKNDVPVPVITIIPCAPGVCGYK